MSKSQSEKNAEKKAMLTGGNKTGRGGKVALLAVVVLIASAAAFFFTGKNTVVEPAQAAVAPTSGDAGASIPLSSLQDGQAKFFKYDDGKGVAVRYFAVKGTDGRIHTAFDACDSCWPEGKGYKQNEDRMVCQNCRMVFDINKIGEVHGGCNPSPLKAEVTGDKVFISYKDLSDGRHFFDLPKDK